jgi:hypothetical protein
MNYFEDKSRKEMIHAGFTLPPRPFAILAEK